MCYILILDDDPSYGKRLARSLERRSKAGRSYRVTTTHTIAAAKDEAQRAVQSGKPFDVFLIDQKLGPEMNGIEVMVLLRAISPESGAIIITGLEDPDDGLRALEGGAYKYLIKGFNLEELLIDLDALEAMQKTQRERDWLHTLSAIAEQSLGCSSFQHTAETLARGALRLGFDRVSIFRYDEDQPDFLSGVAQAGQDLAEKFNGSLFRLDSWPLFEQAQLATELAYFSGEAGPGLARGAGSPAAGSQTAAPQSTSEGALLPLRIGERFMGVLVLEKFSVRHQLRAEERQQLQLLARIAAGNLERVRLLEVETTDKHRLALLQSASEKLLDIVNQDEEKFWRTLLTLATADYALGFNRAWVFLLEARSERLRGMLGIGHLYSDQAQRAWERDVAEAMSFERFLKRLQDGSLRRTPLEALTRGWRLELDTDTGADGFLYVLQTGGRKIYSALEARQFLPEPFIRRFGAGPCAILPLRAGGKMLGVVVVDNCHNHQLINASLLDRLETFLNIAGLAWQDHQQNKERDALLDAAYAVMDNVAAKPLRETLAKICASARTVTGADAVVLYPLQNRDEPLIYDVENIVAAGAMRVLNVKEKPRQKSVSAEILRGGPLLVDDVLRADRPEGQVDLSKHPFILRENVRAMIGVPVTVVEGPQNLGTQNLGVLYLNYQTPQRFTQQERKQAEAFANLAAFAILNTRNAEAAQRRQEAAELYGEQSRRELRILHQVLTESLLLEGEDVLVRVMLVQVAKLLSQDDLQPTVTLRNWVHRGRQYEPREEYHSWQLDLEGRLAPACLSDDEQALLRRLFETPESFWYSPGGRLMVPIRLAGDTLGALSVIIEDSRSLEGFRPMLQRFASAVAMALDYVRRQGHLLSVLQAAKAVTAPLSLQETFDAIVQSARQVSPDMSALTLWYLNPDNMEIRLGSDFGLLDRETVEKRSPERGSLIWQVMAEPEPVWLVDAAEGHWLVNRFIQREKIISAAAFPLSADNERIGAMFFNYRRRHFFTDEEKVIFKILAEVVATSIRDALHLEMVREESLRLKAALVTAEAIGGMLDLETLFRQVLENLRTTFDETIPCLLTYNAEDCVLEFTQASRDTYPIDNPDFLGWGSLRIGQRTLACRVARKTLETRAIEYALVNDINNPAESKDYAAAVSSTRSELCVSLCSSSGDLLGVFLLERTHKDGFDPEDVDLARAIAQQISVAIERAQQSTELGFSQFVATSTAWAAEFAHDIHRASGSISKLAYLLRERAADISADEIRRYSSQILTNVQNLGDGILGEQAKTSISVDEAIRAWADEERVKRTPRVEIELDLQCQGVYVSGSKNYFRRILRHLTRNAIEAMEGQEQRRITVSTHLLEDGRRASICFADNGRGIDSRVRHQLFNQPIAHPEKEGGYGLILTRQMISDMGGSVRLLPDQPSQGAVFEIKLPVAETTVGTNEQEEGNGNFDT